MTATGDFASRMTEDLNKMQDGMGEKVFFFSFSFLSFFSFFFFFFFGGEGEASNFDLTFASKVGMLFRFIATGIGGFVYPFTQVERSKIGNSFFSFVRTGSYPWSF